MNENNCPHCNVSLQGEPIPKDKWHLYGNKTHFGRQIGIYSLKYDKTIEYQCPDCKGTWNVEGYK